MKRGTIYPSWRYHKTAEPRLIQNAEQDDALSPDWSDEDIRQVGDDEKVGLKAAAKAEAKLTAPVETAPEPTKTAKKKTPKKK